MVMLAGELRSFERAAVVYQRLCGGKVPAKTIQRLVTQIGPELVAERDADSGSCFEHGVESPPQTAVVQCDGGRIMTRAPGAAPGVHEPAWKETKCAGLFRMTHHTFDSDPQPRLPPAFRDRQKVAELAEKAAPQPSCERAEETADAPRPARPKPLHRTVLASMANSRVFGEQMAREAKRRRFDEATSRAFLGDGLPWNWSIHAAHFATYTPILDFIHVVSYLYQAALVLSDDEREAWGLYERWAGACWRGEGNAVVGAIAASLAAAGIHVDEPCDAEHPLYEAFVARRYLEKNLTRMKYPEYRCAGLPVTSSLMESIVKQINMRTKGTEMFWSRGAGAEAILQIRAAVLCDDNRLARYLQRRKGNPHIRPRQQCLQTAA